MKYDKTTRDIFFTLLRGGLWEEESHLMQYGVINFSVLYEMAEEQSVVGLIAAGLERVNDMKVLKQDAVPFIGRTLKLEQRNMAMNDFINVMVDRMNDTGINVVLLKGQGVAQCYERPLWRASGDVDFFLDDENYEKAKALLIPLANKVEVERVKSKHLGMTIEPWVVELHGTLHCRLSERINKVLNDIHIDVFRNCGLRAWMNGKTSVKLLSADNDAIYVFTHFLSHYYQGGFDLDLPLLESRLHAMGLSSEWKAFGAFAVEYLGLPAIAMPLYSEERKWKKKANMICAFVMEVGNFGKNRDMSYYGKYPYLIRKIISFGQRSGDLWRHARIFPMDSLRFFPRIFLNGVMSALKREG